jgi:hypothetical protein
MATRTSGRIRPAAGDLVVPALDAVVEGAWIALVYASIQVGLAHGPAVLGPLAFAVAAAVGLAWARAARGRAAEPWAGVMLAVALGAVGWLADPAVRDALAGSFTGVASGSAGTRSLETAVTTNAAGWLLGLAVLRGASHGERARDEEKVGRLMGRILLLAIPWAIGLAFGQEARPAFIAQALVSTILFAGAGLLAVGLGRLETLGSAAGVDWRSNRAWVAVAVLVVALVLVIAVPAAFLVGVTPAALLDAAWIPLGTIAGLLGVALAAVATPILAGIEGIIAILPTPAPTPVPSAVASLAPGSGVVAPVEGDPRVGLTITIFALVALGLLLVFVVARIRAGSARRTAGVRDAVPTEERTIEMPRLAPRLPSVRVPFRHRDPGTAPAAYLALLEDLAADPALARRPAESPRAHAARLAGRRGAGAVRPVPVAFVPEVGPHAVVPPAEVDAEMVGADWSVGRPGSRALDGDAMARHLHDEAVRAAAAARPAAVTAAVASDPATRRDLALLVADWELARYAGRTLTPAEDARGVARWRRLRRTLRSRSSAADARR